MNENNNLNSQSSNVNPNPNQQQEYQAGNFQQAGTQNYQNTNQQNQSEQFRQQGSDPNAQYPGYQKGPIGTERNPALVVVLSFITCGIYGIVWMYQVSKEINQYTNAQLTEPNYSWLSIFCLVFFYINSYKLDQAIIQIDRVEGRHSESRYLIWLILSLFFGVGNAMMQYQVQESLNEIWAANRYNYNQNQF
ncbi:MAG: DUF4234 domain-containing protein [Clostridiaceae bacterium]|nr:DUF4234 domain-containing protein [Clostridiaceae bacterium]